MTNIALTTSRQRNIADFYSCTKTLVSTRQIKRKLSFSTLNSNSDMATNNLPSSRSLQRFIFEKWFIDVLNQHCKFLSFFPTQTQAVLERHFLITYTIWLLFFLILSGPTKNIYDSKQTALFIYWIIHSLGVHCSALFITAIWVLPRWGHQTAGTQTAHNFPCLKKMMMNYS